MNHNVSIINLSLASKTNMANSVLAAEIEKAVNAGVQVVGAAGNNNADVKDYMPGSVSSALIIGAANEDGTKLQSSNYGDTVDYNVVAESTSEAAAKFSGFMSTGIDIMSVINVGGLIYQTDYEAMMKPETPSPSPDVDDKDIPETEPEDAPWVIGDYPEAYTTEYEDEKIYTRDVTYDFIHYNPYDDNVTITCDTPDVTADFTKDAVVEYSYSCKLNDNPDYRWTLDVIFTMVNDKEMATAYSKDIDKIFPSVICQERNKGYGGIVPEHVGDTVEGRSFNVLADTEDFDVEGLIQDYNPHTFKINSVDMNGFDIHTPGTYTVTYEMSYFMYFNYTWFVRDDLKRKKPESASIKYDITYDEITELLELLIAEYNNTPHRGIDNLTPLECMRKKIFEVGMIPTLADEKMLSTIKKLNFRTDTRKVCGKTKNGKRAYINFMGTEYRSNKLALTGNYIGQTVTIMYNPKDISTIDVYTSDGLFIDTLIARGEFGTKSHSIKTRKNANRFAREQGWRQHDYNTPIAAYEEHLNDKGKKSRRAATQADIIRREQGKPTYSELYSIQTETTTRNLDTTETDGNKFAYEDIKDLTPYELYDLMFGNNRNKRRGD